MAHPSSAAFGGLLMPGTGHLMLPVSNSILQFFDLQKDEQAQLLQVRHLSCTWMLSLPSGRVGYGKQALQWHSMLHGGDQAGEHCMCSTTSRHTCCW